MEPLACLLMDARASRVGGERGWPSSDLPWTPHRLAHSSTSRGFRRPRKYGERSRRSLKSRVKPNPCAIRRSVHEWSGARLV